MGDVEVEPGSKAPNVHITGNRMTPGPNGMAAMDNLSNHEAIALILRGIHMIHLMMHQAEEQGKGPKIQLATGPLPPMMKA